MRREVKSENRQVAYGRQLEPTDAGRHYLRQPQKQRRAEERSYVKVMVILLLDKGRPAYGIADDFGLDDVTVQRYAHAWWQLRREKYLLREARSYWGLRYSARLAALSQQVARMLYPDVSTLPCYPCESRTALG
jgi:hypothetical protein